MENATAPRVDSRREALAVGAVLLVWLASLTVGWTYQYATENATRHLTQDQISVAVPATWIVDAPSGDLVLVTRNPLRREETFSVSRLPEGAGTLDEAARENRARAAAQYQGYLVGDIRGAELNGGPADRTAYSFIRRDASGRSSVLEGLDYVVISGSTALVIAFVCPIEAFDRDLPAFERFALSVSVGQP